MIRVRRPVVDEPVLGVEEEDFGRPRGAVGLRHLLRLVVEEREGKALLLRAGLHVLDGVAEVAGVRVDGDEPGAALVLARDVVQPVLPGDHVRAVDAREDDGERPAGVVLRRMRASVDAGEVEARSRIAERETGHDRNAIGVGPLYDAVGIGMRAYSRSVFRVRYVGPKSFRLRPGTLIAATHRKETDVPLIASELYFRGSLWKRRSEGMHFAARDDMFLRGFFAGFPPEMSPRARRLLFPISVGRFLPRVAVHPISSASTARLAELLAASPDEPLGDVAPERLLPGLRERGLPASARSGEALQGSYADLLWEPVTRGEGPEAFWSARATRATTDFRELVGVMREGKSLVVFPEGRPSPDGEVGPLRRGLDALVRRGKPERILPVTLAYDPLVRGRTEVTVVFADTMPPPHGGLENAVLERLKKQTALTSGQFVAHELAAGREPHPAAFAAELVSSRALGRPIDPVLADPARRAAKLAEARAAAEAKPEELSFLAKEFESARS
jgi:1-acyl-sn-glycerol-3-phosphate acyltransferase